MPLRFDWIAQRPPSSRRALSTRWIETRLQRPTLMTRARLLKAHVVLTWRRIGGVEGPSLARRVQWRFGHLGRATAIRRGTLRYRRARLVGRAGRSRAPWSSAGRQPTRRRRWASGAEPESPWGPIAVVAIAALLLLYAFAHLGGARDLYDEEDRMNSGAVWVLTDPLRAC